MKKPEEIDEEELIGYLKEDIEELKSSIHLIEEEIKKIMSQKKPAEKREFIEKKEFPEKIKIELPPVHDEEIVLDSEDDEDDEDDSDYQPSHSCESESDSDSELELCSGDEEVIMQMVDIESDVSEPEKPLSRKRKFKHI